MTAPDPTAHLEIRARRIEDAAHDLLVKVEEFEFVHGCDWASNPKAATALNVAQADLLHAVNRIRERLGLAPISFG